MKQHAPARGITRYDAGPEFHEAFVDVDEQRTEPVPHRYVHGGFAGTDTRFSFYFPPVEQYEGRFSQHVTPIPDSEYLAQSAVGIEGKIDFAAASGAYFVETNGGGPNFAMPGLGGDPTISAYRANAACAQYSRIVAARVYGDHRPYGYLYGGSGGGFRTIGAAENTAGVWDGFVPYVIGSPLSIPNVFTARMHALRILRDQFEVIDDAFAPGGSGDPSPLLDEEERAALSEVTRMGFPPRSWFGWRTMGAHAFSVLYGGLKLIDPDYFTTFWATEGYLGADPHASVHRDRLRWEARVAQVIRAHDSGEQTHGPRGGVDEAFREPDAAPEHIMGLRLDAAAPIDAQLADLTVTTGRAAGTTLVLRSVVRDVAIIDIPGAGAVLEALEPGDTVSIDNSDVLAAQTYHRHQVPTGEYAVWDQFRHADGAPLYPQRPFVVGPVFAQGASGSVQTGALQDGRMIVVSCLLDREAYAWQADWYASKVQEHLGADIDDRFRLWYIDHGLHGDNGRGEEHPTRSVPYLGVLHQALRQLAAWIETGAPPAESTRYRVNDGQIEVSPTASERRGVQPVAELAIQKAPTGEEGTATVRLTASVPPRAGQIVAVDWDLDGDGAYDVTDDVTPAETIDLVRMSSPLAAGTHFLTAKVVTQGDGNAESIWARVETLARVRVVIDACGS